ncbi:MAG: D-lyxose/D-mannose family sugar isomerase [Desulfobacula sp.]|uniref:D-lyxose/D-mannose family sugar isomerase n=1 Tax=Desulfobacula sp. TaxID=2593537 RepID=UPI0025C4B7C1|nr:D-lyxose/D-mannose family sugar isomerase [Desulfobacula sp.]MCD4722339.1 D-lyxose/D-mannose family sugar isomerase [Desulfobacula sp.]
MKRSKINKEIETAKKLIESIGFKLPPFAFWTLKDWAQKGHEVDEIVENMLGWDVTDYGCGHFDTTGLLLFTIRNGNSRKKEKYPKTYAEKLMVCKENQVAPMHFHWKKKEDIINRGGGNLVIVLFRSTLDEKLSNESLYASVDGVLKEFKPGQEIILKPGESIFLEPFIYHSFYTQKGSGPVVIGEVSQVNDDENDNCFLDSIGRFPTIEEDEKPLHLLCTEYTKWINIHS